MVSAQDPAPRADYVRWPSMSKVERWSLDSGDLHNMLDDACDEIERLRTQLTGLTCALCKRSVDITRRGAVHYGKAWAHDVCVRQSDGSDD